MAKNGPKRQKILSVSLRISGTVPVLVSVLIVVFGILV